MNKQKNKEDMAIFSMAGLLIILVVCVISAHCSAQSNVAFSIHQDARLLVAGDDKGNSALTPNILARFQMNGNQDKHGYFTVSPSFEFADIDGKYYRYTAEIGYTFNQIFNNWEHSINANYGWIDRYGKSTFSWGSTAETNYIINDKFKISLLAQLTERSDLGWIWGQTEWRFSGFLGLKYNIN